MMKKAALIFLLVLGVGVFLELVAVGQTPAQKEKGTAVQAPAQLPPAKGADKAVQTSAPPEKIVAGPQNIRERSGVYVFVVWLWAAIIVLIYIVRLEIKEADRVLNLKFFSEGKK